MGNAVPPRMCRGEADAVTTAGRRRRPKNSVAADAAAPGAAPWRSAAVAPLKQRDAAEQLQQEEGKGTARRRAAGAVSWAGGVGAGPGHDDDAGKKASAAATVTTVKIVLKRKDAEALVARLNAQGARERKARMAELKGELRGVDCSGGGGGASPAPCRDAWKPRLAPINES